MILEPASGWKGSLIERIFMRVIVNIHCNDLAKTAGWRAKPVYIENKNESCLDEVLKAVIMNEGMSLKDILIDEKGLKKKYILFVNGVQMPEQPDMDLQIRDNVQIHIMKGKG